MNDVEARIADSVSRKEMRGVLEALCRFERVAGTAEDLEAAELIMAKLKAYGVPAELHEFQSFVSRPIHSEFSVYAPFQESLKSVTHAFGASTPPEGVSGEVLYLENVDGTDVSGKVVLTKGGLRPGNVLALQRGGAAAIVNMSTDDKFHQGITTGIWGTPALRDMGDVPCIPVITILRDDGEKLAEASRRASTSVHMKTQVFTGWKPLRIPVAYIEGQDAKKFLLVGGHTCSWWEGATDNGTGNACAVELARVLHSQRKDLKRSIRIAWWPGHSQARYSGSTWYSDAMWNELDDGCLAYLNIDSPGVRNATEYTIRAMAELEDFNKDVVEEVIGRSISGYYAGKRRPPRTSDQSFWGIGIPSLRVSSMIPRDHEDFAATPGSAGAWWWHTDEDTLDKVGWDVLETDTKALAILIARLLNSAVLPWRPTRMADEVSNRLGELKEQAGAQFDLSKVTKYAERFAEHAERLEKKIDGLAEGASAEVAAVNECLGQLSRIINPVLRTEVGRFYHEPVVAKPLFPGLSHALELAQYPPDGDLYSFTMTQTMREANRVVDCLARATEAIARVL